MLDRAQRRDGGYRRRPRCPRPQPAELTPRASAAPACQAFRPGERWGFSASPAGSRSEVADLKTTSEASMGKGAPKVTSVTRAKPRSAMILNGRVPTTGRELCCERYLHCGRH